MHWEGAEKRCRAKIVKRCRQIILTIFAFFRLREKKSHKVSKIFLTLFDLFLSLFRWPLLRSADTFKEEAPGLIQLVPTRPGFLVRVLLVSWR